MKRAALTNQPYPDKLVQMSALIQEYFEEVKRQDPAREQDFREFLTRKAQRCPAWPLLKHHCISASGCNIHRCRTASLATHEDSIQATRGQTIQSCFPMVPPSECICNARQRTICLCDSFLGQSISCMCYPLQGLSCSTQIQTHSLPTASAIVIMQELPYR